MSKVMPMQTDPATLAPILEMWKQEANGEEFGMALEVDACIEGMRVMVVADNADLLMLNVGDNIVGFIGMTIFKSPLSDERIANEHYFFVHPKYRKGKNALKLLKAAEDWAEEHKCDHLMMNASCLASDMYPNVCRLYERKNFKTFEKTFIKKLERD